MATSRVHPTYPSLILLGLHLSGSHTLPGNWGEVPLNQRQSLSQANGIKSAVRICYLKKHHFPQRYHLTSLRQHDLIPLQSLWNHSEAARCQWYVTCGNAPKRICDRCIDQLGRYKVVLWNTTRTKWSLKWRIEWRTGWHSGWSIKWRSSDQVRLSAETTSSKILFSSNRNYRATSSGTPHTTYQLELQ